VDLLALITAILIVLAVLLVVLLLLLLVSFHISMKFCKDGGKLNGQLEVRWYKIRFIRREFPEEKEEKLEKAIDKEKLEEEPEKPSKPRKWTLKDIKRIILLFLDSWPEFFNLFQALWKSVKLEKVNAHLILGFDSPVDTAKTVGYLWAASSVINISQTVNISAEPSFVEEKIDLDGDISFKIRFLGPFLALLRMFTRKSVLKLLWELRRFR
jgi:hypothetical protein